MFLEKLEVQGFKSFANKNALIFPGMLDGTKRGITAVVGPNGSGKSNVADSVRWALGEQSMKTLRGKKSEDVIFSGSDKKGKLGMAEVSLHLNNEDKKAPIDYSQIVLTRRLYRNGDSEYLINNSKVRLADIQMLLAKASFGQKTYSVIGQGMVERFLNTSLAERKEFFDEATGVKQYQIKRDEALNKLRNSYENLLQAQMLVQEIEPRIKSLTRQVNKLRKRGELETELEDLQTAYYSEIWNDLRAKFKKANDEYLEIEKDKIAKDKKLAGLNADLEKMKNESLGSSEFEELQAELSREQSKRNELTRQIAKIEAQIEVKLEAEGKFDLSFLMNKKEDIRQSMTDIASDVQSLEQEIEKEKRAMTELNSEKETINKNIQKINNDLRQIGIEADTEESEDIKEQLAVISAKLKTLVSLDDIEEIKRVARELEEEIEKAIKLTEEEESDESPNEEWTKLHLSLEKASEEKEGLSARITELNLQIGSKGERIKLQNEKLASLKSEETAITQKISTYSGEVGDGKQEKELEDLNKELTKQEEVIAGVKEKLSQVSQKEDEQKQKLFALQKDLQNLQNEINGLNNNLQAIKIDSTRHETKLEDLEIEIREELGSMEALKKDTDEKMDNLAEAKEKITYIKRQLEQIGGIDPAIENEYTSTKERYDFLENQTSDLSKTIDSLEKVIKELDIVIRDKFDKEFKLIAKKFEEYFKVLFNGGSARIDKVMEEQNVKEKETEAEEKKKDEQVNLTDLKKIKFLQKHNATGLAGIEIKATPPGKKITSISMLSGGERALTAIALICAIISSNPSPFVVLDEVDAALDEANSERLAKILDELSHKTQFIVITHNRASMRRANILYGVTMGDDGISKLLSVKLDEVKTR
ncbi:hypothetical protein C0583_06685 [Candidatus Parcubacteria bacterium]|nr:MAG: hypothetical protein C0583_06685 [Candidatus Parcubacteria bacterium]